MLEKIINALDEDKKIYDVAKETLKKVLNDIERNYNGELLKEKKREAQKVFDDTVMASRETHWKICEEVLNDIEEKAKTIVSKPTSPDFINKVETLKMIKNPTEAELDLMVETFKGDYLASRAMVDAFKGIEDRYFVISYEAIKEKLNIMRKELKDCFTEGGYSYTYRVLMYQPYMNEHEVFFQSFLNGEFIKKEGFKYV